MGDTIYRPESLDDWINDNAFIRISRKKEHDTIDLDGRFDTMMARVAQFHSKHDFANNNGHDMGYRLALTIEELGELSAAITKGKPKQELEEELADIMILILGHALAMEIDLEKAFHNKLTRVMKRPAKKGSLGIRVTEYLDD